MVLANKNPNTGLCFGSSPPSQSSRLQCMSRYSAQAVLLNARSISNKGFILNYLISTYNLDVFLIAETWVTPGDEGTFLEPFSTGYSFMSTPRGFYDPSLLLMLAFGTACLHATFKRMDLSA